MYQVAGQRNSRADNDATGLVPGEPGNQAVAAVTFSSAVTKMCAAVASLISTPARPVPMRTPPSTRGDGHRRIRPEPGGAQPGQQGRVGLQRLADAADHHRAGACGHPGERHHAVGQFLVLAITQFGEPGDRVPEGRMGGVTEDVEHPALHGLAHHVLPPARLIVDQVPLQAKDADQQALGQPVLAHDADSRRPALRGELDLPVAGQREQAVALHPGRGLRHRGHAVPEPFGDAGPPREYAFFL